MVAQGAFGEPAAIAIELRELALDLAGEARRQRVAQPDALGPDRRPPARARLLRRRVLELEQMLDDRAHALARRSLEGAGHVLDLLDQGLEIELGEAAGAQQRGLRPRPGVDVLLVEAAGPRLGSGRHALLPASSWGQSSTEVMCGRGA